MMVNTMFRLVSLSLMMIIELLFAFAKTGQHTRLYGHFNQFLWVMAMFYFVFLL